MILKLEQVATDTSLGSSIFQMDTDEIISVEPQEKMKNGLHIMDMFTLTGYYSEGTFSNLMKYLIKIKLRHDIIEIEFSDIIYRDQAIDYIYNEMIIFIASTNENKFYRKDYKQLIAPQIRANTKTKSFKKSNKEYL